MAKQSELLELPPLPEHPPNRPHFHVWLKAKGDKMFYKLAWPYNTRQAARQWAQRREPNTLRFMVLQCCERRCAPKLD